MSEKDQYWTTSMDRKNIPGMKILSDVQEG